MLSAGTNWQNGRVRCNGTYVEVEGELRYREYKPVDPDRSIRIAEIYASSIPVLDRSSGQPSSTVADSDIS